MLYFYIYKKKHEVHLNIFYFYFYFSRNPTNNVWKDSEPSQKVKMKPFNKRVPKSGSPTHS